MVIGRTPRSSQSNQTSRRDARGTRSFDEVKEAVEVVRPEQRETSPPISRHVVSIEGTGGRASMLGRLNDNGPRCRDGQPDQDQRPAVSALAAHAIALTHLRRRCE